MGEEWASTRPFQFFSSHPEPELARSTAEGRKAEFAAHGWDADTVPDPQDLQTFRRSKLDWDEPERPGHAEMLAFYRELIRLRRTEPDLADPWLPHLDIAFDEAQRWIVLHRGRIAIACNLGAKTVSVPAAGELLLSWGAPTISPESTRLPGHSVAILRSPGRRTQVR